MVTMLTISATGDNLPVTPVRQLTEYVWLMQPCPPILSSSPTSPLLPQQFVFKSPDPTKTFGPDTEWRIYNHLQPLQGNYIPRCYGQASWTDRRTGTKHHGILLEMLAGTPVIKLPKPSVQVKRDIIDATCDALQELARHGVIHGDVKLDNAIYTGLTHDIGTDAAAPAQANAPLIKLIDFGASELVADNKDGYDRAYEINLNDAGSCFEWAKFCTPGTWRWEDCWSRQYARVQLVTAANEQQAFPPVLLPSKKSL